VPDRQARVVLADDQAAIDRGNAALRILIDRSTGSEHVHQRLISLSAGRTPWQTNPTSEEVGYVAEGIGQIEWAQGRSRSLRPGTAWWSEPGLAFRLVAEGSHQLVLISVLSPPPTEAEDALGYPNGKCWALHEEDQEDLPAGDDRHFRLLIEPKHGARNVTQFVGFIDRSRAPFHTHTYEEAIYILEGEGLVHIEGRRAQPIRRGTSIFLPPGTPHCLENAGPATLKLLGVFSPPGSPANRMDQN